MMSNTVICQFQCLNIRGWCEREKQNSHRIAVDAMLINGDASQVFLLLRLRSLASIACLWGSESWMGFYIVKLAQSFSIFIEFAEWLECFNINIIRFNGFTFSEVPNFLHFLLI